MQFQRPCRHTCCWRGELDRATAASPNRASHDVSRFPPRKKGRMCAGGRAVATLRFLQTTTAVSFQRTLFLPSSCWHYCLSGLTTESSLPTEPQRLSCSLPQTSVVDGFGGCRSSVPSSTWILDDLHPTAAERSYDHAFPIGSPFSGSVHVDFGSSGFAPMTMRRATRPAQSPEVWSPPHHRNCPAKLTTETWVLKTGHNFPLRKICLRCVSDAWLPLQRVAVN